MSSCQLMFLGVTTRSRKGSRPRWTLRAWGPPAAGRLGCRQGASESGSSSLHNQLRAPETKGQMARCQQETGKLRTTNDPRDVRVQGQVQPTRLLRPWDFPGKSTGVGCHCLLQSLLGHTLIKAVFCSSLLTLIVLQLLHLLYSTKQFERSLRRRSCLRHL